MSYAEYNDRSSSCGSTEQPLPIILAPITALVPFHPREEDTIENEEEEEDNNKDNNNNSNSSGRRRSKNNNNSSRMEELAIVPYGAKYRDGSSDEDPLRSNFLTTRRVCPTCLRPFPSLSEFYEEDTFPYPHSGSPAERNPTDEGERRKGIKTISMKEGGEGNKKDQQSLARSGKDGYTYYYANSEAEDESDSDEDKGNHYRTNSRDRFPRSFKKNGRQYFHPSKIHPSSSAGEKTGSTANRFLLTPFHFRALESGKVSYPPVQTLLLDPPQQEQEEKGSAHRRGRTLLPLPPIPEWKEALVNTDPSGNHPQNNSSDGVGSPTRSTDLNDLYYTYFSPTRSQADLFDSHTRLETEEKDVLDSDNSGSNKKEHFTLNGYYEKYFLEERLLGRGSYGGVFLCYHIMEDIILGRFAIKKIPVGDDSQYLKTVLQEVRLLTLLNHPSFSYPHSSSSPAARHAASSSPPNHSGGTKHPNILEYHHSWVEEAQLSLFSPKVKCLFILMEYATEGSLDHYLERKSRQVNLKNLPSSSTPAERGGQEAKKGREEARSPFCLFSSDPKNNRSNHHNKRLTLSHSAVWFFFLSALAGTTFLHERNIIHRDLKPQNLLLTYDQDNHHNDSNKNNSNSAVDDSSSSDSEEEGDDHRKTREKGNQRRRTLPRVLVSDFGTATLLTECYPSSTTSRQRTGATGTEEYMAPELFITARQDTPKNGDDATTDKDAAAASPHYTHQHSKKSDVWSLGIILYYLCSNGHLPPRRYTKDGEGKESLRGSFSVVVDEALLLQESVLERPLEMIQLMKLMLQENPKKRPSCRKILYSETIQTILYNFNSKRGHNSFGELFVVVDTSVLSPARPKLLPATTTTTKIQPPEGDDEALGLATFSPSSPLPGRIKILRQRHHHHTSFPIATGGENDEDEDDVGVLKSSRVVELSSTTASLALGSNFLSNETPTMTTTTTWDTDRHGRDPKDHITNPSSGPSYKNVMKRNRVPPPSATTEEGEHAKRVKHSIDIGVQTDPVKIIPL